MSVWIAYMKQAGPLNAGMVQGFAASSTDCLHCQNVSDVTADCSEQLVETDMAHRQTTPANQIAGLRRLLFA